MSMWKRTDDPQSPGTPYQPESEPAPAARRHNPAPSGGRAVIGPSIRIQGDLTGEEDLVIEGRVEGKIDLKQQSVTIGESGRVQADVFGRTITVEGEVRGNLVADEQITVRRTGQVQGNLTAPRVSLEDGAKFKGSIDMEPRPGSRPSSGPRGIETKSSPGSGGKPDGGKPEAGKPETGSTDGGTPAKTAEGSR
jgi:cytoskeletal protein CcmA (bactofilin family)